MLLKSQIKFLIFVVINNLIHDLCENSSPEKGLCFSKKSLELMDKIKDFNYKNIYSCKRILPSRRYFNLVITEIYNLLKSTYAGSNTLDNLKNLSFTYPKLGNGFIDFIHNLLLSYLKNIIYVNYNYINIM